LGVLRRLRDLDAGGVLGNHDLHLLRRAAGTEAARERDSFDEILRADDRDELLTWLAARPLIRAWDDILLVHAALSPAWEDPVISLADIDPLHSNADSDFATRVRYCAADASRPPADWPPPEAPFVPWYELWLARGETGRTVVYGHWAQAGLVLREGLRGLDTGCVWGNSLSAWIAEEDRIVQVPAERVWSPTSLG
jgi:bis(5'-nucleosyl)-tetraphosphatase (symmetrical)